MRIGYQQEKDPKKGIVFHRLPLTIKHSGILATQCQRVPHSRRRAACVCQRVQPDDNNGERSRAPVQKQGSTRRLKKAPSQCDFSKKQSFFASPDLTELFGGTSKRCHGAAYRYKKQRWHLAPRTPKETMPIRKCSIAKVP